MNKALITIYDDNFAPILERSRPTFERYSCLHNYEYVERKIEQKDRPTPWYKIPAIIETLQDFDLVLFIDADILIVDYEEDIAAAMPTNKWLGIATPWYHPNTGVLLCRKKCIPLLQDAWSKVEFINHAMWEQAAIHNVMGFDGIVDGRVLINEKIRPYIYWFDPSYNRVYRFLDNNVARFLHFAGGSGYTVEMRLKDMTDFETRAIIEEGDNVETLEGHKGVILSKYDGTSYDWWVEFPTYRKDHKIAMPYKSKNLKKFSENVAAEA